MLRSALSLRLVMLIASLGTALGALIMFWQGMATTLHAAAGLYRGDDPKLVTAMVMGSTDIFLFGIVLVIFAYSIAFGFVFELSHQQRQKLPAWMRIAGMQELKMTLIGVIIVYMVVDFATDLAEAGRDVGWELLTKPISILLLAAALRLFAAEPASEDAQPGAKP